MEICDGIDNNCNTTADEDLEVGLDYGPNNIFCDYETIPTPNIDGANEMLGGIFTALPEGLELDPDSGDIDVENSLPNTYIVTYTSPAPCALTAEMGIVIRSVDVSVTENSPTLTANEEIAYYQWIDCFDDSFITDETNQSFTATEDGSYAVIVTQWGCADTSACYDIVISEIIPIANEEISIYPNPTNGEFNIELDKDYNSVELIITNISGQEIMHAIYTNTKFIREDFDEVPGIYIMEIKFNQNSLKHKLIKQ